MVTAENLDKTKSYKFSTNGVKLGKYLHAITHVKEVDPNIQPPPPPQYNDTYVFEGNSVPSFNLEFVIEDLPAGGRGRYRTTRRKQLRRFRKSHKKIIKNNKK